MVAKIDIFGDKELNLYLNKVATHMKPQIIQGLNEIGKLIEKESKEKLGTYQKGWPALKQSTVLVKLKKGLSGDNPLILHGALKNSIKHEILETQLEAIIYSDEKYAAVQEYGYAPKNVPARSYLRLTLWDEEQNIEKIINKQVGDSLI